jgi:PKD repeat protein
MQKTWLRKGLAFGIIVLFFGASVIPIIKADPIAWNVTLHFTNTGGQHDYVVFGEATDANDGPPADTYDIPKPPTPSTPYIRAWFNDSLPVPYDVLWEDYRHYPGMYKIWNLTVHWMPSSGSSPTTITISWNTTEFNDNEYESVTLCTNDETPLQDMLMNSSYIFSCPAYVPQNFKIICSGSTNQPPNTPNDPTPQDNASNVPLDTQLGWSGGDPDGDPVTYDVYFGNASSPPQVMANQSDTIYNPGMLNYSTTYYWRIVAWDNHGANTTGPTWFFTTGVNHPPYTPDNPKPLNNATDVPIIIQLSWSGGDPDQGDTVSYDVFFGTINPPPKMVSNQSATTYDPGIIGFNTTFYWRIISWDDHGANTSGPTWSFTTGINHPPYTPDNSTPSNNATDVPIIIQLSWTGGDPDFGDTVLYDIYFGVISTPPLVVSNQSGSVYDPGTMSYLTTYYWRIVAWDNHGVSTVGPIWNFITITPPSNLPPVANFTYTITDRSVSFNASLSYDNDGNITLYTWDFGDGTNATGVIVNHIYSQYGTYNVTLTVTDDDGNNDTITKLILVIDFFAPEIVDHTPTIGYTGNSFTFNATITDNDLVSIANVEYWYGTGIHSNVSMTNVAGDYWVNTITLMDTLDSLNYFIAAADPGINWNTTVTKNITIVDDDTPSFVDNSTPTGTTGDQYTFDITATDNIGVANVTVTWAHGQYSGTNVSLNNDGDGTWSLTITLDNNLSVMTYTITVTDTSNNVNTGLQQTVTVTDNDNPVIVDHTLSVAYAGYPFTFNATVTDNILVSSVWVEYWFDSNTHENTSMINNGDNNWEKTIIINLTSENLSYIISADDSSSNWINTGIITVPIGVDYPPSTPQNLSGPTSGYANITYTYTTNATDPNNDQMYYTWDWGDGNYSIWLGPYNSSQIASASHVWTEGNYSITVKAKDTYGLESDWSEPLTIRISVNYQPILTNPSPANNSINMSRPPTEFVISVEDLNGDAMDVYFVWRNHTNEWVTLMVYSDVNNGTYNFIPPISNDWIWGNTTYTWSVNVTDGTSWTNETYTYTTNGSRYDVNNNDIVNFQDAGLVWVHRTSLTPYDGIYDVNNDDQVNFQDAGLTWVHRD